MGNLFGGKQVPHRLIYSKHEGDLTIDVPDSIASPNRLWYRSGYGDRLDGMTHHDKKIGLLELICEDNDSMRELLAELSDSQKAIEIELIVDAYKQGWNDCTPATPKSRKRAT